MENNVDNLVFASDNNRKAFKCWESFEQCVLYNDRYYTEHPLLEKLKEYINNNSKTIPVGEVYYRARIINEDAYKDYMMTVCEKKDGNYRRYFSNANRFKGLTKEGSFVPPNNSIIKDGRANPKYVKFLYMAENPTTAIFEVRPFWSDRINLAEIRVNTNLQIADLTYEVLNQPNDMTEFDWLLHFIQESFSIPTNDSDEYIPSQIIAANIKKWGYDGIRYNSSLHKGGVNLTIFTPEKCEAISSRDMKISNYTISAQTQPTSTIDNKILYIENNECRLMDVDTLEKETIQIKK